MNSRARPLVIRILGGRVTARLRRALPSPRVVLAGAVLWSLLMAGCAFWDIAHWTTTSHRLGVLVIYATGAALAFPTALFLAQLVTADKGPTQRFAAIFLLLALATIGFTALLVALNSSAPHAAPHDHGDLHAKVDWLLFTTLGALYQLAVVGLRFCAPVVIMGLFATSCWFAARAR